MKTTLLILVIGDSIAHGWGPHVTTHYVPGTNCRGTRQHLEVTEDGPTNLDVWTEGKHWDVIVFNAGLHDIQQHVTAPEYRENLRKIVEILRPKCDRLYFCSITPGRDNAPACSPSAVTAYNYAALKEMAKWKVPVIDLHGLCEAHRDWWKSDYDIHYTPEGYKQMAEYIQAEIQEKAHK